MGKPMQGKKTATKKTRRRSSPRDGRVPRTIRLRWTWPKAERRARRTTRSKCMADEFLFDSRSGSAGPSCLRPASVPPPSRLRPASVPPPSRLHPASVPPPPATEPSRSRRKTSSLGTSRRTSQEKPRARSYTHSTVPAWFTAHPPGRRGQSYATQSSHSSRKGEPRAS